MLVKACEGTERAFWGQNDPFCPKPAKSAGKFIETEVANKIPSIGYAYLVRIAEANLLRTLFTTNFDDLLNDAFYQFSSDRAIVCAHDSSVDQIGITSTEQKSSSCMGTICLMI